MAATKGGIGRATACEKETIVCPRKVTQNLSGLTEATLTNAPAAVKNVPRMIGHLIPWENKALFYPQIKKRYVNGKQTNMRHFSPLCSKNMMLETLME
jgi:hypothetical protein